MPRVAIIQFLVDVPQRIRILVNGKNHRRIHVATLAVTARALGGTVLQTDSPPLLKLN